MTSPTSYLSILFLRFCEVIDVEPSEGYSSFNSLFEIPELINKMFGLNIAYDFQFSF